jgi:hypothetical protein
MLGNETAHQKEFCPQQTKRQGKEFVPRLIRN